MKRSAWLGLPALLVVACLYDVADVEGAGRDSGAGGDAANSDVGAGGWIGAAGGGEDAASDAPTDALTDAGDAAPVGTWQSCKTLAYYGACFGKNTVLYYHDAPSCLAAPLQCWVNNCSAKGGSCVKGGSGACAGWGCTITLEPAQADDCTTWGKGQCRDNTAIKKDPTDTKNCLYKDCTALGATCAVAGSADCF